MASHEPSNITVESSDRANPALSQNHGARYYGPSYISGGTTILGDNLGTIHLNHSESYLDRQRLLQSLRYPEVNARFNEIKESHYETLQWIFSDGPPIAAEQDSNSDSAGSLDDDDDSAAVSECRAGDEENSWDKDPRNKAATRLKTWLCQTTDNPQDQDTFLIQGKAGSGKSTFMKFVFEHPRTRELLYQSAKSAEVVMLFHSFWLVGTKLQNNYKGFVVSLVHQLLIKYPWLVECCEMRSNFQHKSTLNDWSDSELSSVLLMLLKAVCLDICIFVDGMDEYDSEDDFDRLLNLFDQIRHASLSCKFCLSSRPNRHVLRSFEGMPSLRLQDLTYEDIRSFVRATLKQKIPLLKREEKRRELLSSVTWEICEKADGVFLWAHYVLKNVCGGLRIDDDLEALLKRIQLLPSAILSLYRYMWASGENDNAVHQEESAKLLGFGKFFPTSLLRLMVAMDTKLQEHYLTKASPLQSGRLDELCAAFQVRLTVRSAGLIECVCDDRADFFPEAFGRRFDSALDLHQSAWRRFQVRYFHRSVHDFLTCTEEGQRLVDCAQGVTVNLANEAYAASYLASVIEGCEVISFRNLREELSRELNAATKLRTAKYFAFVCGKLWQRHRSSRGSKDDHGWMNHLHMQNINDTLVRQNISFNFLMDGLCYALDGTGLIFNLSSTADVGEQLLDIHAQNWSAYYKGYLVLCMIPGLHRSSDYKLQHTCDSIMSWVSNVSADILTPHSILTGVVYFAKRGPLLQMITHYVRQAMRARVCSSLWKSLHHALTGLSSLRKYKDFLKARDLSIVETAFNESDALIVTATINANEALEWLIKLDEGCTRANQEHHRRSMKSAELVAESEPRTEFVTPQIFVSMLRRSRKQPTLMSALLSDEESHSLKQIFVPPTHQESFNTHSYFHHEFEFAKRVCELRESITSWTTETPDIPDIHFVQNRRKLLPDPLDPFAEATLENWKEVCSMRRYFAKPEVTAASKKTHRTTKLLDVTEEHQQTAAQPDDPQTTASSIQDAGQQDEQPVPSTSKISSENLLSPEVSGKRKFQEIE